MLQRIPRPDEYEDRIAYSADEISKRIVELGKELSADYPNGVTLLCNQKASVVFLADLMRAMTVRVEIEFLQLGSIKQTDDASPLLFLKQSDEIVLQGKDVVIITDVVRTGFTMHFLINNLASKSPSSLEVCTLLHNPEQQLLPIEIKYAGYNTDYDSVAGYGISYKKDGRNFPDIVTLIKIDDDGNELEELEGLEEL